MNQYNSLEECIADLNAQLDALASEFQAAFNAPPTTGEDKTGMERALDVLARAGQIVQQKLTVGERGKALQRYTSARMELADIELRYAQFVDLNERARRLHREIERQTESAKAARFRANEAMNKRLNDARTEGVPENWINAIVNEA